MARLGVILIEIKSQLGKEMLVDIGDGSNKKSGSCKDGENQSLRRKVGLHPMVLMNLLDRI